MAKIELTFILPELAAILDQKINASIIPTYLGKIISKASFEKNEIGLERILFNHFGSSLQTGSDLPINHLETEDEHTLRADPCYLHADRDRLLLFANNIDLTQQESDELIAEIQPLFLDFGGRLSQSDSGGWLLKMEEMPDLNFSALPEVTGKGVDLYLPKGSERQDWIRLWNEVQMKLYASELNQKRMEEGKVPINSVWFWGAGTFTAKDEAWAGVQGQLPLLKWLAEKSASPLMLKPDYSLTSLSAGQYLWLADGIDIESDWLQQMEMLDEQVIKSLWQYCRSAKIGKIYLQIPEHGTYQLGSFDCWKFW